MCSDEVFFSTLLLIMKKYIVEFLGTFFLVLTIGLSGNPLTISAVLVGLIYMGGHISKAHYNPAVTIAFYLNAKIDKKDVWPYWVAQFAGALLAGAIAYLVTGKATPVKIVEQKLWEAILLELLFTFAMVMVILHVAISPKTEGNQYYGFAIGCIVFAGINAAGPISGAAFNPAVSIGNNLFTSDFGLLSIAVHTLCSISGAVVAAATFKMINNE